MIFLDVLTRKYPDKTQYLGVYEKVILNKEVSQIKWKLNTTMENVEVSCADGSTYVADHVIFTPSIGVLKECADVIFHPSLPEPKKMAIEKIGFGAILKVFALYSEPWWAEHKGFPLIWDPKDLKDSKNQFPDGPEWVSKLTVTTYNNEL